MKNLTACLVILLVSSAAGCLTKMVADYDPAWVAASWTGGAVGEPNDRIDTPADKWDGQICPPDSVLLSNHQGFAGLTIVNNCSGEVTYGICIDKGSMPQPEFGLKECAEDPLETPLSDLTILTLAPGIPGKSFNATEILSVNIFYCSNENTLTGSPVRCTGS